MKRVGLLILGIGKIHWNAVGKFISGEGNFIVSYGKGGHRGVEIIVDGRYKHLVLSVRVEGHQRSNGNCQD